MPRWLNILFQSLAIGAQFALPFVVNPHSQMVAAASIGGLQAISAVVAHAYNPDGTPATVAFQK